MISGCCEPCVHQITPNILSGSDNNTQISNARKLVAPRNQANYSGYLRHISLGVANNLAQYVEIPGLHAMSSSINLLTAQPSHKAHPYWRY